MKCFVPPALSLLLLLACEAHAQTAKKSLPPQEAVKQARQSLDRIRARLATSGSFDDAETKQLLAKVEDTGRALDEVTRLVNDSSSRDSATAPLVLAAGTVLADDVTGVGVADDVLLPVIGLALVASYVHASLTTDAALATARQRLLTSAQALALAMEIALAKKKNDGKCHCTCAGLNSGPVPRGRRTAAECAEVCKEDGFTVPICR